MKFSIATALTFSLSTLVYAQGAPQWSEIAVLKNEQRALVVEVKMTPAKGGSTVELEDCLNDLARFAKETKARGGVVYSTPDYISIGDQSQVENVRNVLLGLRCELSPKPPF
jgi:hypothetical protein